MQMLLSEHNGHPVMRIVGRLDSSVAPRFTTAVQDVLRREARIVVDLAGLTYVSSAGLRSFLVLAKEARADNRRLVFCSIGPDIQDILETVRFRDLLVIFDDLQAATAPRS
jgi:anti-anti-sigma factor